VAARNRLNSSETPPAPPANTAKQPAKTPGKAKPKAGMLGIGLDNEDGHKRLTRGDNFLLVGGSAETHEVMQETAIKVNEQLAKRGKRLEDASPEELRDIFHDIRR
jgi:hypothetical protein